MNTKEAVVLGGGGEKFKAERSEKCQWQDPGRTQSEGLEVMHPAVIFGDLFRPAGFETLAHLSWRPPG